MLCCVTGVWSFRSSVALYIFKCVSKHFSEFQAELFMKFHPISIFMRWVLYEKLFPFCHTSNIGFIITHKQLVGGGHLYQIYLDLATRHLVKHLVKVLESAEGTFQLFADLFIRKSYIKFQHKQIPFRKMEIFVSCSTIKFGISIVFYADWTTRIEFFVISLLCVWKMLPFLHVGSKNRKFLWRISPSPPNMQIVYPQSYIVLWC